MKPAPFDYEAPRSVAEVLALLAERGDEAKVLAGGQSLVPLLNFRLARPELVVDVNGLGELAYLRRSGCGLQIGALTRQSTIEQSPLVAAHWPLLTDAVRLLAHPQIRNRGTVGGAVAHADPSGELPVAFVALDATLHVRSARGDRAIAAVDFFRSHLTTALEPDELLVQIEVPPIPARTGHAFVEFARRHGDFGLGGAAALVTAAADGSCARAAIALLGAGPIPVRAIEAERLLVGRVVDADDAEAAAAAAVADILPTGDIHGSSAYRASLIKKLAVRAVRTAAARATGGRHAD